MKECIFKIRIFSWQWRFGMSLRDFEGEGWGGGGGVGVGESLESSGEFTHVGEWFWWAVRQLHWNHTSTWVFSCGFATHFSEHLFMRAPLRNCFGTCQHVNIYCFFIRINRKWMNEWIMIHYIKRILVFLMLFECHQYNAQLYCFVIAEYYI